MLVDLRAATNCTEMQTKFNLIVLMLIFTTTGAEENIFTDYCKPGLCSPGDEHTGCKGGVLHNGKMQIPPCSENATVIPLTDSDKQRILDFHNVQRNFVACGGLYKDYGIGPGCRHGVVTWDKELEKSSFLHTSYCDFHHDKCRGTVKYPDSGQNLAIITYNEPPEPTKEFLNIFTYLWYVEYLDVKTDIIEAFYPPKEMVGHFLTSLNERNNLVGCNLAKFFYIEHGVDVVMLSCNYPVTSIIGEATFNTCKNPASKCTTGTDPKYKFLCSSKEKYDLHKGVKHVSYDGDGTETFDDCGDLPELFHYEKEGAKEVKKQHKKHHPNNPIPEKKPKEEIAKKPVAEKPVQQKPVGPKPVGQKPAGQKPMGQKPAAQKPVEQKPAGKKPPVGLDSPAGNPAAGGEPDYSEDDYDPLDSSSTKIFLQSPPLLRILAILIANTLLRECLYPILDMFLL